MLQPQRYTVQGLRSHSLTQCQRIQCQPVQIPRHQSCNSIITRSTSQKVQQLDISVLAITQLQQQKLAEAIRSTGSNITLDNLTGNVQCMSAALSLPGLQQLFETYPEVLLCEGNISELVSFIQGLGVQEESLLINVVRELAPQLSEKQWSPWQAGQTLAWLRDMASLSPQDVTTRVLPCYPSLLMRSVDELEQVVGVIRDTGLLEDEERIKYLLNSCPAILLGKISGEILPILERIQRSRNNKYVTSGSYHI